MTHRPTTRVYDLPVPCPFCGGTTGVVLKIERYGTPPPDADPDAGWWNFAVQCTSCAAEGPPVKTSPQGALRAWARRV